MEMHIFNSKRLSPTQVQCRSNGQLYSNHFSGYSSMYSTELSCSLISSTSEANQQNTAVTDWNSSLLTDSFSIGDNTSNSSLYDSNSALWNANETFEVYNEITAKHSLDASLKKDKKRRSSKSTYKHVPHREKPVHLVARRNARERKRVQAVNSAFVRLRKVVPVENRNKRLSKVKTLHRAIEYIDALQKLLDESDELSPLMSSVASGVIDEGGTDEFASSPNITERPFFLDGQPMAALRYSDASLMTSRSGAYTSNMVNFVFKG